MPTRSIDLERVYQLAPYQSLRIADTISDLPEEFILNQKLIEKLYSLMAINIEINYRNILRFYHSINELPENQLSQFLAETKIRTLDEIKTMILKYKEDLEKET